MENYDVLGRWRDEDAGAEFPWMHQANCRTARTISGPQGLKETLRNRKKLFLRNLARRMLGYALGRGLEPADACAVETIVENVERDNFEAWSLIRQIVRSAPFLDIRTEAEGPGEERHGRSP